MTHPPIVFTLPPELEGKVKITVTYIGPEETPPLPSDPTHLLAPTEYNYGPKLNWRQKLFAFGLILAIPAVCIGAFVALLVAVSYLVKGHL